MTAGVLFDVDGTLVDSTYLHTIAWWQAFRHDGRDVPMAAIHRAIGMGADQLIPHVLPDGEEVSEDDVDRLSAGHDAIYATHWPALRRFDSARDLLHRCHEAGLTVVLASSAGPDEVATVRRLLDADDWLDEVTNSADGDRSKPAPDLVDVALDKAGLDPASSVFVGDAVWDVQASSRAGVACVGLECGGTSAAELTAAGAVEVYRDPADLLAGWAGSALVRTGTSRP